MVQVTLLMLSKFKFCNYFAKTKNNQLFIKLVEPHILPPYQQEAIPNVLKILVCSTSTGMEVIK